MEKIRIAPAYEKKYLETRPTPLSDKNTDKLSLDILLGNLDKDISNEIYSKFKEEMQNWLLNSNLNCLKGLEKFDRVDIIQGCTQFIDNLYINGPLQILEGDYKYHERLNPNLKFAKIGKLKRHIPILIAAPFPSIGSSHPKIDNILEECLEKQIPVHIDGAWITCAKNFNFDFSHPAIHSVGISLSKGLGLGWNRIGLRWSYQITDSISIMNDFHMNNKALVIIGLHYIKNLPPDYFWLKHANRNKKICKDFNLISTQSIHLALDENKKPVGISPLIRYLEENGTD
jgi:hypothetical protein